MEASKQDEAVLVGNHSVTGSSYRPALGCQLLPLQSLQVQSPKIPVVFETALHARQLSSYDAGQQHICFWALQMSLLLGGFG